jgi:Zn-dependent peptidase ImmA (M78 family)
LVLLKGHWGISIKAILVRAHQLGILSKSAYVSALHAYSTRGYNLAEPGRYPVEEKPIRFEQLLFRAVAEDLLSLNDAASLSNRKLAEMRDLVDVMK